MIDVHKLEGALDPTAIARFRRIAETVPEDDRSSRPMGLMLFQEDRKTLVEVLLGLFRSPLAAAYDRRMPAGKCIILDFLTMRQHAESRRDQFVPWHADSNFVRIDVTRPDRPFLMTAWAPLDDCGETRPSLEFVTDMDDAKRTAYLDHLLGDDRRSFSSEQLAAIIGDFASEVFVVPAGDALLFGQFALHRTQDLGSHFESRTAVEVRFANADAVMAEALGRLIATLESYGGEDVIRIVNTETGAFATFRQDGTPLRRP